VADVFISYKRQDRPVVERLASALQQLGFDVWWDLELLSGESYRQVIRAVIDQCRAAVVVWSKASAESDFVLDEAHYALRLGRLCPVRIEAVDLPFGFGQRHVDDLSDWAGELSHPGFQSLVRSIEERVGRKARLGAAATSSERQAVAAELEAFKAAQLAASPGALRTFVATFPNGAFAPFVRDQIDALATDKPRHPHSIDAAAPAPGAPTPAAGMSRRARLGIGAALAVIALVGVGFYGYRETDRQAREAEAAKRQADEERVAARRRAAELEAQAADERAARERAEQRSAALQLKSEQERQAREQAARLEAERRKRDSAFSLDALHPDLRGIVAAARRNALDAESAAIRARTAAGLAETAAERARAGRAGTISLSFDGGVYQGEGSGSARNGYGVTVHHEPSPYAGDRYAGQFRDNMRSGLGVYTFAENPGNPSKKLRREGEYSADGPNGLGNLVWASGERHSGHWKGGTSTGPGVRSYVDGRRYEGDWVADKRSGLGVLWSADGKVASAGIWKDGKFVRALPP
jgi:hypothetical protein